MSAVAGGSSEGGPSVNRALTLAERVGSGALPVLGGATGRSTRDEMAATGGPRGPVGFSSVLSAVPESYFDRRHQFYVEAALKREATRNERIANRTRLMESDPVNPMYLELREKEMRKQWLLLYSSLEHLYRCAKNYMENAICFTYASWHVYRSTAQHFSILNAVQFKSLS